MGESEKILLIDDTCHSAPLQLVESVDTPLGAYSNTVLATLYGVLSDYGNETRNQRWYTGSLWRKVLDSDLLKEALATKTLYGEADHPLDIENRLETHIPYISHIVREPKIVETEQCVKGYLDILDTPYGRIVKTLIDYGCELGVSSRGSGELTSIDGRVVVNEDTYNFVTWDIVARPSNKKARGHEIDTVNNSGRTAFESLREQINVMIKDHDIQSLRITESLISNTNIPDKEQVLEMIKESIDSESNEQNDSDNTLRSDLDQAYERIVALKKENLELDVKNKSLSKSVEDSEKTISDLTELNKNLTSMVKSYMEELSSEKDTSTDTTGSESKIDDNSTKDVHETKIDYDKISELVDRSNKDIESKLDRLMSELDNSDQVDTLKSENDQLRSELDDANQKEVELETSLKNSQNENVRLIRKVSTVVSEYFKLRCSQLGLNESLARKEFNNRLYEYDLKDIDEVLTELYSSGSSSLMRINESGSGSNKVGSLKLTGSLKSKVTPSESDEVDSGLVESIRNVKLS
jgi:hypothetical protein